MKWLLLIAVFLALVILSLVWFAKVRWYRKPHQGHWKDWED
jgi:hypothetical protein